MKRNFAILTILGALLAVAFPATSMAKLGVYPAGHEFEISGAAGKGMPQLTSSLPGSCTLTKISGVLPAAPKNENNTALAFPISAPTASCDPGLSITIAGTNWFFSVGWRHSITLQAPANGYTIRYESLPGCKLSNTGIGAGGWGVWSNGITVPYFDTSGYLADGTYPAVWSNDGGSCALAGKAETLTYKTLAAINFPTASAKDLTVPTYIVQVAGN